MTSPLIFFPSSLHKTNQFHVAVGLLSNRTQKTSKYDKNIRDTLSCVSWATLRRSYYILATSVLYYGTDARRHGILKI